MTRAWSASMRPAANAAPVPPSRCPQGWVRSSSEANASTRAAAARRAVSRSPSQAVVEVAPTVLARSRRRASATAAVWTAWARRMTCSAARTTSATSPSVADHNVSSPGGTSASSRSPNRAHSCATGCPVGVIGWSVMTANLDPTTDTPRRQPTEIPLVHKANQA